VVAALVVVLVSLVALVTLARLACVVRLTAQKLYHVGFNLHDVSLVTVTVIV